MKHESLRRSRSLPCLTEKKTTALVDMENYFPLGTNKECDENSELPQISLSADDDFYFHHPSNVGFEICMEFVNSQCERGVDSRIVINNISKIYTCEERIRHNLQALNISNRPHHIRNKIWHYINKLQKKRNRIIETFSNFLGWGADGIIVDKESRCIYQTTKNKTDLERNKSRIIRLQKEYNLSDGLSTNGSQYFINQLRNYIWTNNFSYEQLEHISDMELSQDDNNNNNITWQDVILGIYDKLENELYSLKKNYKEVERERQSGTIFNSYRLLSRLLKDTIFIFSNYPAFAFVSLVDPIKSNDKMKEIYRGIINFYEEFGIELEVLTESSRTMNDMDSISIRFYDKDKKIRLGRLANATNYLLTKDLTSKKIPYIIYGYVILLM